MKKLIVMLLIVSIFTVLTALPALAVSPFECNKSVAAQIATQEPGAMADLIKSIEMTFGRAVSTELAPFASEIPPAELIHMALY